MPLDPAPLAEAIARAGLRAVSGVPCAILDPLAVALERTDGVTYVPASVEGESVAIAAGAWLAGSCGAVLLQNSGLGNAINPLSTLAIPYRIPLLLIVSWRGEPGTGDAVHHVPMGAATLGLFRLLEIPYELLQADVDAPRVLARALETIRERRLPSAIVVPRGIFAGLKREGCVAALRLEPHAAPQLFPGVQPATRAAAIYALLARAGGAAVIATTGYTARELMDQDDGPSHFPMQGSMGFGLAIGLGVSGIRPELAVYVLDGDGAALMRLGTQATAGWLQPRRLLHVVLDNGGYASTGGQPSASPGVDLAGVAAACGFRHSATCCGRESLRDAVDWAVQRLGDGPVFLRLVISPEEASPRPRPELAPPELAERFRRQVAAVAAPTA